MKKDGTITKKKEHRHLPSCFLGMVSVTWVTIERSWKIQFGLKGMRQICLLIQVDVIIWNDRTKMSSVHCKHFVWCGWYFLPNKSEGSPSPLQQTANLPGSIIKVRIYPVPTPMFKADTTSLVSLHYTCHAMDPGYLNLRPAGIATNSLYLSCSCFILSK